MSDLRFRWRPLAPALVLVWRGLDQDTERQIATADPPPAIAAIIGPPGDTVKTDLLAHYRLARGY